jgi:hypothetical protein
MQRIALALLVVSAACGRNAATTDALNPSDASSQTIARGALTLTVRDFPTQGGIFWALPFVVTAPSTVTVTNTRYGSLCRLAVDGSASVVGRTLTLDITFAERLTVCTAEIRALSYSAVIDGLSGAYELNVVHHENAQADTVVRRTILVP